MERNTAPTTKVLVASDAKNYSLACVASAWTQFKDCPCKSVVVFTESVAMKIVQRKLNQTVADSNTDYVTVPANTIHRFEGVADASELFVQAGDNSTATIRYRVEW